MTKHSLPVALLLIVATTVSCLRAPAERLEWPAGLPPLSHYEQIYERDEANQAVQTRREYLEWVVRFYKGWKLYQDGWHSTTQDVLYGVDEGARRVRMKKKMAALGKLISGEWAKNSNGRRIRSRELSVWGQALVKSMDRGSEEQLIDRISHDVNALLSGRLDPTEIDLQRYGKPRRPAARRL